MPPKSTRSRRGRSPVAEPGLDAMVEQAVAAGSLHATTSCTDAVERADISLVCVGTPSTARGGTDLSFVRRAVDDIARALRAVQPASRPHSVVIRSTVPPGTVDSVVIPALADGLGEQGLTVGAAMCPEFLREGSGIADFFAPSLVVVGTRDQRVADAVTELFHFLEQPVQVVDIRVAEALKYACNAFHATKVSFTNEVARLLRILDVDSRQVMSLFIQDRVLNISPSYLRPGFAFGGSCLPKDLRSLLHMARMNGADLPLLAATLATNDLCISEVVDRVIAYRRASRRAIRAELQDQHRRPSREPECRSRGTADREGLRGPHLRPGRPPVSPGRHQPSLRRVKASAPAAVAGP